MMATVAPSSADEFLRTLLASGPISAATVMASAASAGYAWRTVQRAADRIGAVRRKDGMRGGWVWALDPDPKAPRGPEDATAPRDVPPASHGEVQGRFGEPRAQVSQITQRSLNKVNSHALTEIGGEASQNLAEPAPSPSAEEASCDLPPADRELHGAFAAHRWRCVHCLAATRMPERFERCPTGRLLWDRCATSGTSAITPGGTR